MGEITVEELKAKMDQKEDFVFIDVREPYEYDEFNLGAKLIPLGEFMDNISALEQNRNDEIIIHCRSGRKWHGSGSPDISRFQQCKKYG